MAAVAAFLGAVEFGYSGLVLWSINANLVRANEGTLLKYASPLFALGLLGISVWCFARGMKSNPKP